MTYEFQRTSTGYRVLVDGRLISEHRTAESPHPADETLVENMLRRALATPIPSLRDPPDYMHKMLGGCPAAKHLRPFRDKPYFRDVPK